jgi:diguanylate cyclase (GGDEF)-like protein
MALVAEGHEKVRLSISVGVAQKERDTASINVLLGEADKAVYSAKHAGRNRVHIMARGKLHQFVSNE